MGDGEGWRVEALERDGDGCDGDEIGAEVDEAVADVSAAADAEADAVTDAQATCFSLW